MQDDIFATPEQLATTLLQSQDRQQTRKTLQQKWGETAVRLAEIEIYLRDNILQAPDLPRPPRVFVSYKWESDEHRKWVMWFASQLERRGLKVVLDVWASASDEEVNVAQLVAEVSRCHRVLYVVTPDFCSAIRTSKGWVAHEFLVGMTLKRDDRIEIGFCIRDDSALPGGADAVQHFDCKSAEATEASLLTLQYNGLQIEAKSRAHDLWRDGWSLLRASLFADAQLHFERAVREFPDVPDFHSHLAFAHQQERSLSEALAALEVAHAQEPDDTFTLGLMAECAYERGDKKAALDLSEVILKRNPKDHRGNFVLGNVLDDRGDHVGAIEYFERSLKQRPKNASCHNNLGFAHLRLKDYEEALNEFDVAVHYDSEHYLALVNRANTLRLMCRYVEADSACDDVLRLFPTSKDALKLKQLIQT